jgi:penicillin-binding protein 2
MPASSIVISMFHRRLLLLIAVMAAAVMVLAVQLGRLTVVHGAEHRERAEAKLVTLEWTPTQRGRILDRQGRVLAKDRPSFDITVDYRVLNGEWVTKRAAALAKKLNRERWPKLSPEERKELIDQCRVPFDRHIDAMWNLFADTARMNRADVDEKRERIVASVERMYRRNLAARLTKGIDDALAKGYEITEDLEEELLRDASTRIKPQESPHIVLPKVDDEVGFAFQKLVGVPVEIIVPGHLFANGGSLGSALMEPLMPGVAVANAGDREYPLDKVTVDMDLGSLPGPMKKPGERAKVTVEGVGYHVLGRVETNAHEDRLVERGGQTRKILGHATQRGDRLKVIDGDKNLHVDEAFAQRVLAKRELEVPEKLRDLGRYEYNDDSGFSGIEESHEADLRGLRGATVVQLETGARTSIDAVHGRDVKLTIDAMLQARIQAAMSPQFGLAVAQPWHGHENPTVPVGTHLNGAAVVLDIETGEILAMVSTAGMSRSKLRKDPRDIFEDPLNLAVDMPWLNRAVARPYPPGSIVKALILNAAVKFGKLGIDERLECDGHLFRDKPNEFRCWIFKNPAFRTTHSAYFGHDVSAAESLMVSCNVFYFKLGQKLGPQGIMDAYAMFGLKSPWELGVGLEYEGGIGYQDAKGNRAQVSIQDAIQMGIGQGPVDWTPLHAADAYATLARGGKRIVPHVTGRANSAVTDLGLEPRAVKDALEGLYLSANDPRGTGHHVDVKQGDQTMRVAHFADLPNVKVWGKTGTAEAPRVYQAPGDALYDQSVEPDVIRAAADDPTLSFASGKRVLRWGDHSWFVVLVGHQSDNRPLYAISVMMEYGGSGGKVSGPIVNQIIRALMSEGYL